MKKNLNFGLFLLFTAAVICFIGFTVVYQNTYDSVMNKYIDKAEKIEIVTKTLNETSKVLSETSQYLNETAEKEKIISEKYVTINTEKEQADSEITFTKKELDEVILVYNEKKSRLDNLTNSLKLAVIDVNEAAESINTLTSRRNENQNTANSLKDDYNGLCDTLIALGGSCTKK